MKQKTLWVISLSIIVAGFSPLNPVARAFAEEIVISGNGAESVNAATSEQTTTTTVSQSNSSDTNNNISGEASSGDNTASQNTSGETAIVTGDASSSVAVENTANISAADTTACCRAGENSITISGNGAGSSNTVKADTTTNISASSNQHATITNNFYGKVNTGNNTASNNNGNVIIVTGNITAKENIKTGPVNIASIKIVDPSQIYNIKVSGNGVDSINVTNITNSLNVSKHITNKSDIFNNIYWDLFTGNNVANKNVGDVTIITGNIKHETTVENGPINGSKIEDKCCKENPTITPTPTEKPTPTPEKPKEESKPPTDSGKGGNGGSSSGSSPAAGKILPVTGVNLLFLAILGNIVMLFFGMVLRLRSGRSPGFAYRFVI